ncbi:MAG TPA: alpha/beta hydrolase [Burkholderiales bacterium]
METAKIHVMPDGTPLHYRIRRAERPQGVVVLLHGLASNLTRWSEFVEHTRLRRTWDLLRIDLRGHGESMMRGRVGMEIWSNDLADILDAEGYPQAILIGHSLGAHLALHFAARFPDRTRGLVLIDPVFPRALRGYRRWLMRLRGLFGVAAALVRFANALGLRRRTFPRRDLRVLDEQVRAELLAAGNSREFVRRYSSMRADLEYFPVSHYLQELKEMLRPLPPLAALGVPILVLLSRGVTYTDPAATERLLDAAPNVERVTVDAYHWPLTEQPQQVREAIEAWFARQFESAA